MFVEKSLDYSHLIAEELISHGTKNFCCGYGSRSTPLVLALSSYKDVNIFTHFDERGCGFFALGLSKGLHEPVAIVVTSGTACGNLLPSIMESYESGFPLIILTADRPYELQSCGANQTTHQTHMFKNFVKAELEIPAYDPQIEERVIRCRIAETLARGILIDKGPIHINCHFREPFDLTLNLDRRPKTQVVYHETISSLSAAAIKTISSHLNHHERGVVLLGADACANPSPILDKLLLQLNWPIFSDPLAFFIPSSGSIQFYSLLTQHKTDKVSNPTCVLHIGGGLVSKSLLSFLKKANPERYIHVSSHFKRIDPLSQVTDRVVCSLDMFCSSIFEHIERKSMTYLDDFKNTDQTLKESVEYCIENDCKMHPPRVFNNLSQLDISNYTLFIGNSMPIRDLLHFYHPKILPRIYGNRALSGIDGNIATACGLVHALQKPLLLIIGDLTFLHDLNSLALLEDLPYPIKILVFNNYGGGIFSFLPIGTHPLCERLFTGSHDFDLEKIAPFFHLSYSSIKEIDTLSENLKNSLQEKNHSLIEVCYSTQDHIAFYKFLEKAIIHDHCLCP